jgi:hypothetical protein
MAQRLKLFVFGQLIVAACVILASPAGARAKVDWVTYGFDRLRSGHNPDETTLGQATVAGLAPVWTFDPGPFEVAIDNTISPGNAVMRGQPTVAHDVRVNGTPTDLVVVGDDNGFLFGLNANSTSKAGMVVWYNMLGRLTVPACSGTTRTSGIESTVTIDSGANGGQGAVFVATNGAVHALALATGIELSGWPVAIPRRASKVTDGSLHDGINIAAGKLYVGTSSNCDVTPYWGRVVRIDEALAKVESQWFALSGSGAAPTVSGGGIWGQGGVTIDTSVRVGGVYVATGNAVEQNGQSAYAENIVNLSRDLKKIEGAASPLIPFGDNDYGATPALFQPTGCATKLVAVPNKIGLLTVDSVGANGSLSVLQSLQMASNTSGFRGAVAWDAADQLLMVTTPTDGPTPYLHGLSALQANAECTSLSLAWQVSPAAKISSGSDPFSPVTTANGVAYMGVQGPTANQIFAIATTAGAGVVPGQVLWTSPNIGGVIIPPPAVVNGRLFATSLTKLTAFALPGT